MRVTERVKKREGGRKRGREEKRKKGRCADGEGEGVAIEREREREYVSRRYLFVRRTFNTQQCCADSTQLL